MTCLTQISWISWGEIIKNENSHAYNQAYKDLLWAQTFSVLSMVTWVILMWVVSLLKFYLIYPILDLIFWFIGFWTVLLGKIYTDDDDWKQTAGIDHDNKNVRCIHECPHETEMYSDLKDGNFEEFRERNLKFQLILLES